MAYARLKADEIDYISAHGTGTPENDRVECVAIKKVFNGAQKQIPVSSIKSMLGHSMGAAAVFETIACCLAIKEGNVPPTINVQNQDPECDIDCVPNRARRQKIKIAFNNSQAFGGNNGCVVFNREY